MASLKIASMPRIRLILAWLVMAALPLQGFAAASMLWCGAAPAARVSQAHGHASDEGHGDHAHHAASSDSRHGHAAHADAKAGPDKQGHTCAVCASCCQVVAVNSFDPLPQVTAPPGAQPPHPHVRIATRIANLPDKPPRV
jgi:hypothetical protein